MKMLWVLVALAGVSIADLPSCERARCSHCEVKFIAKVCKKTCDACPQTITEVNLESRLKSFYEEKDRLSQANKEYYKGTKTQKPLKKGPVTSTARQTGVPSLAGLKEPREVRFQQPYHYAQYAAPQTGQVPVVQYPQQQPFPGVSTLAPLLPALRPTEINSNLASQPADLAQPLPEYGRSTQIQSGFQLQQPPTQYQNSVPAPTPYYNTNQNPFPSTSFSQPTYQPAQSSQTSVQYPQQQPTSPLLNPFQPFMQQTGAGSAQSLLDPFGLFNLGALAPVTPAPNPFAPPQTGFGSSALTNQQPLQQPTLAQQQPSQGSYFDQSQQLQYDQQRQVNYNYNTQTYPGQQQQVPAVQQQQRLQNVYGQQSTNYATQQQQQQPRSSQQVNQQALPQYRVNQPQPQQQRLQVQGSNAVPRLPSSSSIDAPPINVQKYVDGKGSVPQPPPQQCPRQPGWAPCITKQQANERFTNCCARLGDGCTPLCNYDAPLATMQLAVLTGRCPLNKMADIMVCASGYEDATACCEAYNVFEPGYEQCRPYCNPAAGLPQGGLLSEKYKCLAKLSHIQQCFYVSQKP
uniref:DB domain-containing protein n=1 Tax=Haemonchus contortus TaxID=6289 RepID=A0A7I4Y4C2_HAECO